MNGRTEMTDQRAWTIGAIVGAVAFVLLWLFFVGFLAGLFWGIVLGLIVAILLLLQSRSSSYEGSRTEATPEAVARKSDGSGAIPATAPPVPSPPKVRAPKAEAPEASPPRAAAPTPVMPLAGTAAERADGPQGETYTGAAQTPREADPSDPAVDVATGAHDEAGSGDSAGDSSDGGSGKAGGDIDMTAGPAGELPGDPPGADMQGGGAGAAGSVVAPSDAPLAGDEDGSPARSGDTSDAADAGAPLREAADGTGAGTTAPGMGGADPAPATAGVADAVIAAPLANEPGSVEPGEDVAAIPAEEDRANPVDGPAIGGEDVGTKPAALDGPRGGDADDLKMIRGIGPKLEDMLHGMGIYHYDQIASWGPAEVAWCDSNLKGFRGRVTRDTWVDQARLLASGEETEFAAKARKDDIYGEDGD